MSYVVGPYNRMASILTAPSVCLSAAEPVIEKALAAAPEDAIFVHVAVGPSDL